MTKGNPRKPKDDQDEEFQATLGDLDKKTRQAVLDALTRLIGGQPAEDCYIELFIELGDSPALARKNVRTALRELRRRGARPADVGRDD